MIPRPEYPRPQFFRDSWQNLNGTWAFEIDYGASGVERGLYKPDYPFQSEILVPFCPESELSGIGKKDFMCSVWYRRSIHITKEQLQGRILIHFGAVDYEATVYINGVQAGTHKGGYVSFSIEITALLHEGENSVCVHAVDDVRSGRQPRGKQSSLYYSHNCDYTRTTGIWQTVWLEFLPQTYIRSVKTYADATTGILSFEAKLEGDCAGQQLHTTVSREGTVIAECCVPCNSSVTKYAITIANPILWDVGAPNLYDITYTLGNDTVQAYTGFRTAELRDHVI